MGNTCKEMIGENDNEIVTNRGNYEIVRTGKDKYAFKRSMIPKDSNTNDDMFYTISKDHDIVERKIKRKQSFIRSGKEFDMNGNVMIIQPNNVDNKKEIY